MDGKRKLITRIYQDLPGFIHEDTVMDGHWQGEKQTLINTPPPTLLKIVCEHVDMYYTCINKIYFNNL